MFARKPGSPTSPRPGPYRREIQCCGLVLLLGVLCLSTAAYLLARRTAKEEIIFSHTGALLQSVVLEGQTYGTRETDSKIPEGVTFVAPGELSEEEIARDYKMVDIVYTWINGSDISERFKKLVRFGYVEASSWRPGREPLVDLLNKVVSADSRDRDSGELKASLRSLHQNVNWHEGRLFLVSAGTIPTFLDTGAIFMSRTTIPGKPPAWTEAANYAPIRAAYEEYEAKEGGRKRRIIVMHQDAIVPESHRTMSNSNNVEPYLWRIPRLSSLFIHFNDDYMIAKPTKPTTFFNLYGGPNLFFERDPIRGGASEAKKGGIEMTAWLCACFNTNSLIGELLDADLNAGKNSIFHQKFGTVRSSNGSIGDVNLTTRFYIKHAPYVYSKNLLKYISSARSGFQQKIDQALSLRSCYDVLIPYVHHALAMDAPWRAIEPKFLRSTTVTMYPDIGAPPAVAKIGQAASGQFLLLTDEVVASERSLEMLRHASKSDITFYSINDGFQIPRIAEMLQDALQEAFPTATPYEKKVPGGSTANTPAESERIDFFFGSENGPKPAMALFITHLDYICPVLRSLQLALPQFDGPIHFFSLDYGDITGRPSNTVELSGHRKTGLESFDMGDWVLVCHINKEKVNFSKLDSSSSMRVKAAWQESEYGRSSVIVSLLNQMRTAEALHYITVESFNPVFGQTVSLEDFVKEEFPKAIRRSNESNTYYTLKPKLSQVAFIHALNARAALDSYPWPYLRYEHFPHV